MKFKESETLELKKSTSELKEAIIAIAAILNKHGGGKLYFGIKNDGTVIGQTITEKTIRDISQSISEHIEPKIFPKVQEEEISGKSCIAVAFEGSEAPYFAFGRAYVRVGDENRQLSAKELERLFLRKNKETLRWDYEPSDYKLKDISEKVLRQYIKRANASGRISFSFDHMESVLKKLGLLREGKLRKAAEVLFCNRNSLKVQLAVFAGKDKLTFLDIQMFEGNMFELIERSEQYLKEKMNWRAEIVGLRRQEIPEIPIKALREAIINSFCHRDYCASENNYIAIFKDRVEISNPGRFPEGLTPDDFIKGKHESVLRNPLIAEVLYKSKEIEHWGSGLKTMFDQCRASNVPVNFEMRKTGFRVTFYRPVQVEQGLGGTQKTTQKTTQKIVELIGENPRITRKELAQHIGITEDGIKYHLGMLQRKKVIKRVGPDKGGHWEIRKK